MNGFDLSTYGGALKGGTGPDIIPGKPDDSRLIIRMEAGGHPGHLTEDELKIIRDWILSGAPES